MFYTHIKTHSIDTANNMTIEGKRDGSSWRWANGGINGDGQRICFWRWMHDVVCRWCFVELYTWNLYGFVNQTLLNKLNNFFLNDVNFSNPWIWYMLPFTCVSHNFFPQFSHNYFLSSFLSTGLLPPWISLFLSILCLLLL